MVDIRPHTRAQRLPNEFQISKDVQYEEGRPLTPPVTSIMPLIVGSNCDGRLPAENFLAINPALRDISKIVKNVAKPAPLW